MRRKYEKAEDGEVERMVVGRSDRVTLVDRWRKRAKGRRRLR